MVSNLVENLTRDVMLELAGESYFERGEDYHRGGHVHDLVEHAGVVVARVAGTEDCRVRLWAEDDLVFSCDCPLGLDGEFCKHCVAAGLAWFEDDFLENAPGGSATMHDVHTYLEKQERGGPGPYRDAAGDGGRATAGAAPAADLACGGCLDLAAFRWAVDDAVDFDDYLGSPWDCASGIQNVVGAIAELLEEGFAPKVVELSEYALGRIEGARAYDVDGTLSAAFSKGWRSSLTKPASGWSRTRRRWRNGSSSGSWAATTIRSSTQ
jgi:hypothetical protein